VTRRGEASTLSVPGAAPSEAGELARLRGAFATFVTATRRLEREYAALRERVALLAAELEEKNRPLADSLARERRLEAEALRQSRLAAMGEMAATLAHEVRNPLGAMELFTGLLLQDLRDRPEAHALAEQVARGIADLNHLVTNLLEFTRTRVPRAEVVDCRALAEDALRYTADLQAANRVTVVRDWDEDTAVTALGDPDLSRPVVLNLVRNALQAMPDGGALTVSVRARDLKAEIAIADTGQGIAPDAHEEVFRPFYTTRTKGTGLGLPVARGLVTAMGGELVLASEMGVGSTFTVTLPAPPKEEA